MKVPRHATCGNPAKISADVDGEAPSERDRATLTRPGHDFRGQAGHPGDDFDDALLGEATKRRLKLTGGLETLESESLVSLDDLIDRGDRRRGGETGGPSTRSM